MQDTKYFGIRKIGIDKQTSSMTITGKKKLKIYQVTACPEF